MESESVHRKPPLISSSRRLRREEYPHAACGILFDFCSAAHTACGVAGMASSSVPMASVMALMTAAGAAIAPASPQPLMPSGLDGHLVKVVSTLSVGRGLARGMQ